jgi:hypothetical protein
MLMNSAVGWINLIVGICLVCPGLNRDDVGDLTIDASVSNGATNVTEYSRSGRRRAPFSYPVGIISCRTDAMTNHLPECRIGIL